MGGCCIFSGRQSRSRVLDRTVSEPIGQRINLSPFLSTIFADLALAYALPTSGSTPFALASATITSRATLRCGTGSLRNSSKISRSW